MVGCLCLLLTFVICCDVVNWFGFGCMFAELFCFGLLLN